MTRRTLLALGLAAALGGCSIEDAPPDEGVAPGTTSRQVSEADYGAMEGVSNDSGNVGREPAYQTGTPTPPTAVPDLRGGMTATGQLVPVNNSRMNGSVTVSQVGGGTLVTVALYDAPPEGYRVAVNRGRCGRTGTEVAPVGPLLQVGSTGSGTVSDTLPVPAATVMNGQHVVTVNGRNAGPATPPLACADLPVNRPDPAP